MTTLKTIIDEAEKRFEEKFAVEKIVGERTFKDYLPEMFEELQINLKQELTNAVTKAFEETELEPAFDFFDIFTAEESASVNGYNSALEDVKDKQNKFLN